MTPAPFAEYVLPRLRKVAPIDHLVYDELGKEVLKIHNERFQGVRHIEDLTDYKHNQPIAFSNTPQVLSYNQILHQLIGGRIAVAEFADAVRYWDDIPQKKNTNADLNGIVVFPKEGENEGLRQRVLSLLERKNLDVPLLVAGLGIERAPNNDGVTFIQTELTCAREAPYFTKNGKVRYDETRQEVVSAAEDESGVSILVPHNQAGLRVLIRYGSSDLYAGGRYLVCSFVDGRVEVVQKDPKGHA